MQQNSIKYIIACTNCAMIPMPFNIAKERIKPILAGASLFTKSI